MRETSLFRDLNAAAACAGVTAFVWYAFGAIPLLVAVAGQLGLGPRESSSWLFIVWFSGAVSSIALSLYYRQPIPIASTVPGLVYLGSLADRFSFPEIAGANLMAALAMLALGLIGAGRWVLSWLPLPIVMGMFAGTLVAYVTRAVGAAAEEAVVAGAAIAGYLLGRTIGRPSLPPMGLAVVAGAVPALWLRVSTEPIAFELPALVIPAMTFSVHSFVAVSVPLVVLTLGLGNVQGIGFLMAQGYRIAVDRITVVVALNSAVNAVLGGHPAIVARTGVAIVAGPEAGPIMGRYWASIIAAALTAVVAIAAGPVIAILGTLPRSYLVALTGLAVASSLQAALEHAFEGRRNFGALVAFVVAATPFAVAGIPSTFWSLVAGGVAGAVVDRAWLRTSVTSVRRERMRHESCDASAPGRARMREPYHDGPAGVGSGAEAGGPEARVGHPSQSHG